MLPPIPPTQEDTRVTMATNDIDNVGGDTDTKTLQRFIISATKDIQLTLLMTSIQMGCKAIARAVRKAGIAGLYGLHGSENISGDQVKKLDVLSDEIFVNCLKVCQSGREDRKACGNRICLHFSRS